MHVHCPVPTCLLRHSTLAYDNKKKQKQQKKTCTYLYMYTSVDPHILYAVIICYNQLWFALSYLLLRNMISYDYLCSIKINSAQFWLLIFCSDYLCSIMIEYDQLWSNILITWDVYETIWQLYKFMRFSRNFHEFHIVLKVLISFYWISKVFNQISNTWSEFMPGPDFSSPQAQKPHPDP